MPDQPVFYYDLGDPECYLVAEQVSASLPVVPEWEPVLARALPAQLSDPDRDEIADRARDIGLQPLRWPRVWPPETEMAMLAATYAKQIGRGVAYSLAAFRQAFAGGRDLSDEGTVLIAAAACEMHPAALTKAISMRSVTSRLAEANDRARAAGVTRLPALLLEDRLLSGPDCLSLALDMVGGSRGDR